MLHHNADNRLGFLAERARNNVVPEAVFSGGIDSIIFD